MLFLFKRKDSCVMKVKKKKKYQNGGLLGPGDDRPVEGVSMLPTAEVTAQFQPRDEDEAKVYANLGVEGVMALRNMKGAVRGGRDQFARDFLVPALEGALAVETGAGALEMGALAAKFGPKVAQGLTRLVGKGVGKLTGKAAAKAAADKKTREIVERNLELQRGRNFMKARTNQMGVEYRSNDTGETFLSDGTIDRLRKQGMPEADIQDYIKRKGNTAEFRVRELLHGEGLTKKALDDLAKMQADTRLQNLADRAVRQGAREESQAILNLQQEAQKIIDDLNLAGKIDDIEYNALLNDVENLFNLSPGGKVSDFPEQFASELNKTLAKLGLDAKSATKKLVKDADKAFMMNQSGGKMKVLRKKVPGMSVSKSMMR